MHRKEADIEQRAGPGGLQDLLQQQPRRDLGVGPFAPGIHGSQPGGGDRLHLSSGEQAMAGLGGIQIAVCATSERIAIALLAAKDALLVAKGAKRIDGAIGVDGG